MYVYWNQRRLLFRIIFGAIEVSPKTFVWNLRVKDFICMERIVLKTGYFYKSILWWNIISFLKYHYLLLIITVLTIIGFFTKSNSSELYKYKVYIDLFKQFYWHWIDTEVFYLDPGVRANSRMLTVLRLPANDRVCI